MIRINIDVNKRAPRVVSRRLSAIIIEPTIVIQPTVIIRPTIVVEDSYDYCYSNKDTFYDRVDRKRNKFNW